MKEKIAKIKELLKNRRYRAFVVLGLYFVFFAILILLLNLTEKKIVPSLNALEEFSKKTNSSYKIRYKALNQDEIVLDVKDNKIISDKDDIIDLVSKLKPALIYQMIKASNLDFEGYSHTSNLREKRYTLSDASVYLDGEIKDIVIWTFEQNNNINKIKLEFTTELDYSNIKYIELEY